MVAAVRGAEGESYPQSPPAGALLKKKEKKRKKKKEKDFSYATNYISIPVMPQIILGFQLRHKTYNPSRPAENPEKNIQSKPSGPKILKSEKKPIIQTVLLALALALLSTTQ